MKVSYNWLQDHIDGTLPEPKELGVLLTAHAYELEGIEEVGSDYVLEFDVQPNRAHDSFGHRGVAKEISVLTGLPEKKHSEKTYEQNKSDFTVSIEDKRCNRYILRQIDGVDVKASPEWIKGRLEAIGQRSINVVVDITNIVMFDRGQPMHAFDKDKIVGNTIFVRSAKEGEQMTTLDNKEVVFKGGEMVITDEAGPLAIAGIKGGNRAEVDENTKNIILESAHFDAVTVRMTRRALGIETESSRRFERDITSVWAEDAMKWATDFVDEYASREDTVVYDMIDEYPRKAGTYKTGVSLEEVNKHLGTSLLENELADIFSKLQFEYKKVIAKEHFIELAKEVVGKPYVFGASVLHDAPEGFDCSSLTSYCAKESGLSIPRMVIDQYVFSKEISKNEVEPGDLVFSNQHSVSESNQSKFQDNPELQEKIAPEHTTSIEFVKGTKIEKAVDHMGIYIGDGKVLHCTSVDNKGVVIEDLDTSPHFEDIISYRKLFEKDEERFVVTVPDERLDVRIKEDLIEEVARIYGYDNIGEQEVVRNEEVVVDPVYALGAKISKYLIEQHGFSEILTYVFQETGDVELLHPLAQDKKFMRNTMLHGMKKALELNTHNAYLLGLDAVKVFEIGKVFEKNGDEIAEHWTLSLGVQKKEGKLSKSRALLEEILNKLGDELGITFEAKNIKDDVMIEINLEELADKVQVGSYELSKPLERVQYKTFSPYPFMLRDIAVWVPNEVTEDALLQTIKELAGDLLVTSSCFDRYEKDEKVSYAFRLVFQSYEKTLTDEEINGVMDTITNTLNDTEGYEVR